MNQGDRISAELNVAGELLRERDVDLSPCTECGVCTDVCPVAFAMDPPPADLVIQARKGAGRQLFTHTSPWVCTDCRRCSDACPVDIDVARAMEGLRLLAYQKGCAPADNPIVHLHELFWDEVDGRGRVHELSLLWGLRRAVPGWRKRLGLVAMLLGKGKLPLRGTAVSEWDGLKAPKEAARTAAPQGESG